jgi:hypothetical protein
MRQTSCYGSTNHHFSIFSGASLAVQHVLLLYRFNIAFASSVTVAKALTNSAFAPYTIAETK